MCRRLCVGEFEQWHRVLVGAPCIQPVCADIAPLAIMPFALFGSRSKVRTRGAWVFAGFPEPAVQTACCISVYSPFPTSSGTVPASQLRTLIHLGDFTAVTSGYQRANAVL
jgi:hypothetical protein